MLIFASLFKYLTLKFTRNMKKIIALFAIVSIGFVACNDATEKATDATDDATEMMDEATTEAVVEEVDSTIEAATEAVVEEVEVSN